MRGTSCTTALVLPPTVALAARAGLPAATVGTLTSVAKQLAAVRIQSEATSAPLHARAVSSAPRDTLAVKA